MGLTAVGKSEFGRGVFALQRINEGELIEICETLQTQYESDLDPWMFDSGDEITGLIALGNGSMFNHSYEPNAYYEIAEDDRIYFWALKAIQSGQEIFINYNGDPEDQTEWDFS